MNLFAATFGSHIVLAVVLFFCVNWIGKHAVDFGYASTTLFEEVNESVALNFFLRAMSPAVFIVLVSALAVALGRPEWRLGIYWVAIYYYVLRAAIILALNRQRLVSWPRYFLHAAVGIAASTVAYHYLILPNRSLLPNVEQMGNELWLAILAFLYAVSNKVPVNGGPGARRRNKFAKVHYERARARFGKMIDAKVSDETLKLIVYSVLVYEDFARPPSVRGLERLMIWKQNRTTGIMQVAAKKSLSDLESVERGTDLLTRHWSDNAGESYPHWRVRATIAAYNTDDDYISRVLDVMEILAKRVDQSFLPAYEGLLAAG